MGDPKSTRKTYQKPKVPWQEDRLKDERVLVQQYGLRRKKELYRAQAKLKSYKRVAKDLVTRDDEQATREKQQLFATLNKYGLLREENLTDVLSITLRQLLNRRLQTVLVEEGLAHSPQQARQLITHRHIQVDGKRISSPGYLVPVADQPRVGFHKTSALLDEDHPARPQPDAEEVAERAKEIDNEDTEEETNE
jgi:small subunit ribosomal protein S4